MTPKDALENLNKARLAYAGNYQDHVTLDLSIKCLQGLIESTEPMTAGESTPQESSDQTP